MRHDTSRAAGRPSPSRSMRPTSKSPTAAETRDFFSSLLERERGAAAAGGGRLGILDLERLADEVVDEIDDRAFHVLQRDLVDEDLGTVLLDDEIVRLPGAVDVEAVREAGAATAVDGDAQHRAGGLAGHDLVDALCGAFRQRDAGHRLTSFGQALGRDRRLPPFCAYR